MVKVIDAIKQASENLRPFFAYEYYAPTTEAGIATLYDRMERMSSYDPLFCGITWGEYGSTADTSIEIASTCRALLSVNYQVNLTGHTSTRSDMLKWLSQLKEKGLRNLLATRGCCTETAKGGGGTPDFPHAADLVRFIREEFGDYFGIAVVAFPEGELAANTNASHELAYLKAKVDAGADYIITGSVFDADTFSDFVARCRQQGIRCPIIPGILPATQIRQFRSFRLQHLSGVTALVNQLENVKGDETESHRVASRFYQDLIHKLFAGGASGVYFFTLNTEGIVSSIVKGLNLSTHRPFPWKPSEDEERRRKETVRPIHWSSRVTSYMLRTAQWRDFQSSSGNNSTGDGAGGSDINHYGSSSQELRGHHARLLLRSRAKRCAQFLNVRGISDTPKALSELSRIFLNFLDGNGTLPWADELSGETAYMNEKVLKPLNARALFTINSQPHVNGLSSSNKVVGWGPSQGYIYQKSYIEFFCPASLSQTIFATLEKYPSLQYMAANSKGRIVAHCRWPQEERSTTRPSLSNGDSDGIQLDFFGRGVTAVTWGVFPGNEIIQPTIVSIDSFRAWAGEAFDLWAAPFPQHDIPAVVGMIQSEWLLLSIADNNFQESPSPLERAAQEICCKVPPLVSVGTVAVTASPTSTPATETTSLEALAARYKSETHDFSAVDIHNFMEQQQRAFVRSVEGRE